MDEGQMGTGLAGEWGGQRLTAGDGTFFYIAADTKTSQKYASNWTMLTQLYS